MPAEGQCLLLATATGLGVRCRATFTSLSSVGAVTAAAAAAATCFGAWRACQRWRRSRRLDELRARRQADSREAKARFGQWLAEQEAGLKPEERSAILALPTCELVDRLRSGSLEPGRVLLAYQSRAYEVDKELNCVIEFLQPDLSQVNLKGPLAGLPVSIKENLAMSGHHSCFGLAAFAETPAAEDCLPVRILRELGGVPFVRTGVPQTMMTVLSHNPIDGAVRNPAGAGRSPGGSSSGEAALVAAGGSPLGLGTDIGGSIRLPAAWCGAAGFKPTSGRLTLQKFRGVGVQKLVTSSWGPIARDVDSLTLFTGAFCASEAHERLDPGVPPLGFNSAEAGGDFRPMRIGYYLQDHHFRAVPSAERAVRETVERLARRGHVMVPWQPPVKDFPLMAAYLKAVSCDGAGTLDEALDGDRVSYSVKLGLHAIKVPWPGRRLRCLWSQLTGDSDSVAWLSGSIPVSSALSMWRFNLTLLELRARFMQQWRQDNLDAVICPAVGCPAVHLEPASHFIGCLSYLVLYNVLNFPAGTVSVTRVTAADAEAVESGGYPREVSASHAAVAAMQAGSQGLPVSVQCAALPWRDETCLRVMAEVQAAWAE